MNNTEFDPPARPDGKDASTAAGQTDKNASTLSLDPAFLPEDVKTEDPPENRTNVRETDPAVLMDGTSVRQLYKHFRAEGMKRGESLFNALYLVSHNRYERGATAVKKSLRTVHAHPKGWSTDKKKTHAVNGWFLLMKALDAHVVLRKPAKAFGAAVGRFFGKIRRIPHMLDNSRRALRAFFGFLGKAVLPVAAAVFVVFTVRTIARGSSKPLYLGVYVNGIYEGNTASAAEIAATRRAYESDLTALYGTPVVLQCRVSFGKPGEDGKLIAAGDTSIYDAYMEEFLQAGYGLYVDNKLAAVTAVGQWMEKAVRDYTLRLKQSYMRTYHTDVPETFSLDNAVTIAAGRYPRSYFLSESELRRLFSLPQDGAQTEDEPDEDGGFSFTQEINYASLDNYHRAGGDDEYVSTFQGTTPSDVSVAFVVVRDETETVKVPYGEQTIPDDTVYEGMRRLVRPGVDGETRVHYKVTYSADKILKREVLGEEVLTAPVDKIVRVGTKPVTDDLRRLLPTGTYIYPYQGKLTSYFGWRVLSGSNEFHKGIDISGPHGASIVASDGGVVSEAGDMRGYGNCVIIQHDEETYTRYAHCDTLLVQAGDYVGQGDVIATIGNTGWAQGYHVHFEIIKNGAAVDPLPYMSGTIEKFILD